MFFFLAFRNPKHGIVPAIALAGYLKNPDIKDKGRLYRYEEYQCSFQLSRLLTTPNGRFARKICNIGTRGFK
ncbi:hypothetical protein YC2023_074183 [Brassica napus]